MPELPEVETVCRGLARELCGRTIQNIKTGRKNLRLPFPPHLATVTGHKIKKITRRAKYILIHLDDARTLIVHLGMSGRMVINPDKRDIHDHVILTLDNRAEVILNDPRRFGLVALADTQTLPQHRLFRHLGPEPLDKAFDAHYLAGKLKNKKTAIKLAIMDQRLVVGVGNIYASEALFMAGIDPRRKAGTLKKEEVKNLVTAIRHVLKKAITAGGSSLRDYVQADGELGYFQHRWTVYGKEGQPCKGGGIVRKITQGGRSTFYCPVRQK